VPSGLGKRILGAVGVLLAVMGFIEVGLLVYLRIREGRGAESWVNAYGQTETWGSYGGSVVGALLILAGSALVGWWQLRKRSRQEGVSVKEIRKDLKREL
jgi:hypothetical protein